MSQEGKKIRGKFQALKREEKKAEEGRTENLS